MPPRMNKPCCKPGCPELTKDRYCEKHKKDSRRYDQYRGSAAERGYDARWRKARAVFLKQNPLCVHCQKEGRLTAATVVDHIIPHKGDYKLFWDVKNNWQSLCKRHHDIKTVREDGGFGNG